MNAIHPALMFPDKNSVALDTSAPGKADSSSNAATSTANNQLDGNSFITLLTAQLQAQDPLNPLDPNQMVSELTSMNTLQQIIQIREDMDSMLQSRNAPTSGSTDKASATQASAANSSPRALLGAAAKFMPFHSTL
jgi:flagellar hook assembly protein FlgD